MKLSIGKQYTDEDYVREIQNRNESVTKQFYSHCKSCLMGSCKKLFSDKKMAEDFFQDSFIKLWKEINHQSIFLQNNQIYKMKGNERAEPLACSLRTYLMAIVKNDYRQYLKRRELLLDDLDNSLYVNVLIENSIDEDDLKSEVVAKCVEKMSGVCYKILTLFYYEKKTLDEIMQETGSTSKDGLKTRKHKCMETLKSKIEEKFVMYKLKPYKHERGNVR